MSRTHQRLKGETAGKKHRPDIIRAASVKAACDAFFDSRGLPRNPSPGDFSYTLNPRRLGDRTQHPDP